MNLDIDDLRKRHANSIANTATGKALGAALDELQMMRDREELTISDLSMLVRRLIKQLRKYDASNPVSTKAMEYLIKKGLCGSILRSREVVE